MFKMKNKDLIMFGMIFGIGFFFIGAMVSNVFPSEAENLASYRFSAFVKLLGIGILTACMVVGGIIVEKIDRNLRMLLLMLGLILLIIYTIGSPMLNWDISGLASSAAESDISQVANEEKPTALGTPGFEAVFVMIAIAIFMIIRKFRSKGKKI